MQSVTYTAPLIIQRADPWIYKHTDGFYYFTASVPSYNRMELRRAQTIEGLAHAAPRTVWRKHAQGAMSELISLPKLKRVRCKGSRRMLQRLFAMKGVRIGTITISKDIVGHYFISLQLAADIPFVKPFEKTGSYLGIDLNIENFYADSNGNIVANPKYYRKQKHLLANVQRKLSRRIARAKKEGRSPRESKNVQKQRLIVARITTSIMARRKNFLHNISTALIKNHDVVVAEELRSRNLLKNHALAMSIQDNGWRTFLNMLTYKANLHGKSFVTVNPRNTTQTCHVCGHIMTGKDKLTLAVRAWDCPECGTHHVRDVNAAKNILAKGLAKLAV